MTTFLNAGNRLGPEKPKTFLKVVYGKFSTKRKFAKTILAQEYYSRALSWHKIFYSFSITQANLKLFSKLLKLNYMQKTLYNLLCAESISNLYYTEESLKAFLTPMSFEISFIQKFSGAKYFFSISFYLFY